MKIKDIGGEFALIKRITKKSKDKNVLVGIGDDAAVIKVGNKYLVITTDTLVEDDHFSLKWFSPMQIGMKAIEVNVSDIAAKGGMPKYALISLVLRKDTSVEFVDELYVGLYKSADKYKLDIVGGNTTHGSQIVVDVCMIGEVSKKNLCLRSSAKPNDLIFVTGGLGSSIAGLNLFRNNISGFEKIKKAHLEPEAQLEKSKSIARYANAMIDISDGLAGDLGHICEQSKCGAVVYKEKIPITQETKNAAKAVGKNALDYALYGGEDFQLLFTVPKANIKKIKGCYFIGKITKQKGVSLVSNSKKEAIKRKGYDHFLSKN